MESLLWLPEPLLYHRRRSPWVFFTEALKLVSNLMVDQAEEGVDRTELIHMQSLISLMPNLVECGLPSKKR